MAITKDITITDDGMKVMFCKKLWNEAEVVLAKCYSFHIDLDNGIIVANILYTAKEALRAFVAFSFKNFSESIDTEFRRNEFYAQIDAIYQRIDDQALQVINANLPYAGKFYAHQQEGIRFGLYNRAVFLAFTMRLGKSICAASLTRLAKIERTLIVCPSVAKIGWFEDLTKNWGFNELYFTILDATKRATMKAFIERFIIINYDTIDKHFDYITSRPIGHIIIDESHRIKNVQSQRYKLIQRIVDHNPGIKITFLSGTAIPNRFNDLFAYFKLAGHHLGENYKKFCEEFTISRTGAHGDRITGAKNIADLRLKMLNFMLVKTMDDCFDMPEDVVSRYTFELDDYKEEYDNIIAELSKTKSMSSMTGNLHSLNIITSRAKIKGIIEALEEIIEENGKVVVFGSYTVPLQELEDYFGDRCVKVDGSVSSNERYRLRTVFMEDPSVNVFLGNYLAAGEALDLSVANDVMTINIPFTPREMLQAIYRCKHPEKRHRLRIHHAMCKDSIDEILFDLVTSKSRDINMLLHDGKEVIELENMNEVLIKRLLKRENFEFDYSFKAKDDVEGEEAKESEASTGNDNGSGHRHDLPGDELPNPVFSDITTNERIQSEPGTLGNEHEAKDGSPSSLYYLMCDSQEDSLLILNEEEYARAMENQWSFEILDFVAKDTDVNKLIARGRTKQLRMRGSFDARYIPNPDALSETIKMWDNASAKIEGIPVLQAESFSAAATPKTTLPPPPNFTPIK